MTAEELLEKGARALQSRYGEPKPIVTLTDDARIVIRLALEEAAKACEQQRRDFLSKEYATGQPVSSVAARFACRSCAAAIRALIPQEPSHDQ